MKAMKELAVNKVAIFTEPPKPQSNFSLPPKECFGSHLTDRVELIQEVFKCGEAGIRYYVVDWEMRGDGFVPLRSFIKEEDLEE
jgi:hypothetical protein